MKIENKDKCSLLLGDNIQLMKTIEDNSIDSVVTDPPYGLSSIVKRFGKSNSKDAQFGTDGVFKRSSKGFMGKEWDADVPSVEFWKEVYRILKPGGHILSFGGTRTYHRMATAIEDAGFEIRDQLQWIYASGFPKSHNIGKAIDKIQGNEREVIGTSISGISKAFTKEGWGYGSDEVIKTKGKSIYEAWGTGLKPANEPICLARKPISERTIALNVIKHGTGGINIDGCRIEYTSSKDEKHQQNIRKGIGDFFGGAGKSICVDSVSTGRFPSNVLIDESIGEILDEQGGLKNQGHWSNTNTNGFGEFGGGESTYYGTGEKDKSKIGASKFFYVPKVSKKERNMGLETFEEKQRSGQSDKGLYSSSPYCIDCGKTINGTNDHSNCKEGLEYKPSTKTTKNIHPTVKPIQLMSYLVKLITPIGGTVLDPFMGSGSGGIATLLEGFNFVGMEQDPEYFEIATARIKEYESYLEIPTKPKKTKREKVIVEKDLEIGEPVSTFWLNQAV
jgi:site-specific DNA-methyltransferase (adenine-specific)